MVDKQILFFSPYNKILASIGSYRVFRNKMLSLVEKLAVSVRNRATQFTAVWKTAYFGLWICVVGEYYVIFKMKI